MFANPISKRFSCTIVMVSLCGTSTTMLHAEEVVEGKPVAIVRDATFQRLLDKVAAAKTADEFDTQMIPLRRHTESDWTGFFEQLLYRYAENREAAGEVKSKSVVGNVIRALQPQPHIAINALAPQLDNEEPLIAGFASELMKSFEDKSVTQEADLAPHRAIVEADFRAERPTRASLIRVMYRSDPAVALRSLMRAYQLRDLEEIRSILLGDRDIERALWKRQFGIDVTPEEERTVTETIESFAKHPRWWVRLYVARMAGRHRNLVATELMDNLKRDRHFLVREAAGGK